MLLYYFRMLDYALGVGITFISGNRDILALIDMDMNHFTPNLGLATLSIRLVHLASILRCYTYIRTLAIAPPAGFQLSRTHAPSSVNAFPRALVLVPKLTLPAPSRVALRLARGACLAKDS